jgi:hypothetical protein
MKKLLLLGAVIFASTGLKADTFGTRANQFSIDFVDIGNPGNAADPATGYGAVPYSYRIGKYTISQDQVNAAIANGLSNVYSDTYNGSSYTYYTSAGPACDITWFNAAAYVNWLNTNQGYSPAYNLTFSNSSWTMSLWDSSQAWTLGGTNHFRNKNARYFLPSDNEWYKAAFYDPNKLNGIGGYWLYTTGSDTPPDQVSNTGTGKGGAGWNNGGAGTNAGTTVWGIASWAAPADVTRCGGLSPYGTMGQGGNALQWIETSSDQVNTNPNGNRPAFGYGFFFGYQKFSEFEKLSMSPLTQGQAWLGFRVASTDVTPPQITPPSIISQPTDVSLTATNSQTATFSVVVTNGVPPYACQWMKDGVDLTNQTNASLILSNAAANTVGYYSCDVTDQNGTTVTSSNASLNITGVNFWEWQGLVAYYPFRGNFKDFSFTANDLTNVTTGIKSANDRLGFSNRAVHFSYYNDSAQSVNPVSIQGNDAHTFSCWIQSYNIPSWSLGQAGSVVTLGISNSIDGGISQLFVDDHNGDGGSRIVAQGAYADLEALNLGIQPFLKWRNLVYVYTGSVSQSSIYLDGKPLPVNSWGGGNHTDVLNLSSSPIQIGSPILLFYPPPNGAAFAGATISDLRIYNRALSSNEVSALFQAEAPVPTNNQTITFPTIPSKAYGTAPFKLTATSSAGTNYPITYSSSDPSVATVSSNKVTITGVGSCLITASQPGDFIYKAATNVSRTLTVTQGSQTIPFSAPASRSYTTKTFTLPLNSSAGLPVSYSSSDSSVATISGNVVTITGPGSTVITATQDGNANYKAAPTVNQTLVVSQATQTISFPAIASKAYGAASFSLAAKATSGLPVTYTSSNTNVATVSGNTVTIRGVGSTTITASQAGNANYVAAPSVGQSLTVTKAAQTITFTAPAAQTYGNSSFTLSATASSGLYVSFASANTNVATISGNTVIIVGAGSASITATQAGNANYNAATSVAKTLTVAKAAQTVSFSPTTPVTYVKNGTFTLSASSTSGGAITFTSGNTAILSITGKTATMKAKGTVSVTATAAATTNYNAASKTNSITLQ